MVEAINIFVSVVTLAIHKLLENILKVPKQEKANMKKCVGLTINPYMHICKEIFDMRDAILNKKLKNSTIIGE